MINRIAWCLAWLLGWEGARLPTPQQASAHGQAMQRLHCPQFYCHACSGPQRMRIEEADEPIKLHCGHTVQYDSDTGVWE